MKILVLNLSIEIYSTFIIFFSLIKNFNGLSLFPTHQESFGRLSDANNSSPKLNTSFKTPHPTLFKNTQYSFLCMLMKLEDIAFRFVRHLWMHKTVIKKGCADFFISNQGIIFLNSLASDMVSSFYVDHIWDFHWSFVVGGAGQ